VHPPELVEVAVEVERDVVEVADVVVVGVVVPPGRYAESIQLDDPSTVFIAIAELICVAKLARPLFHAPGPVLLNSP
jgi:hypothetical protein